MPYTIEWHASNNVLIVTYQKKLTVQEHVRLCKERATALDAGPAAAVVLADMRAFDGFPDASKLSGDDNVLDHPNVHRAVIVLPEDTFRQLARALVTDYSAQVPVLFTATVDDALIAANALS